MSERMGDRTKIVLIIAAGLSVYIVVGLIAVFG